MNAASLPPLEIFRAYDIRGVVGQSLTEVGVYQIGRAIGTLVRRAGCREVVVGRDGRLSGPALSDALVRGLAASGCGVIDVGMVPTPVVYFASYEFDTGCGVAVTGSHNPPDYNGLKIVVAGKTLSGEDILGIRALIEADDLETGFGHVREADALAPYRERILGDVKLARRLRVGVDCGNGVAGASAPALIEALGCEVVPLFAEVDGNFPNHHPDPTKPENLQDLIACVREKGLDLGVAFDGDGDRLGVVTASGRIVFADRLMILFARDVLSRVPGATILFDVKCTRHLPRAIAAAGGRPLMWKTGHSLVKAKMAETGAALAGEMSGHIFFKERWYGFDDGVYAACRLLEYLSRQAETPEQVFAAIPDSASTPELHLHLQEGEHFALMKTLTAAADFPGADVSTLDGIRADYPDGFGLVRASNTTPVLVMRFEADDQAALERIEAQFRALFARVRPDLTLPF
ncbi:MAG: phosphomannomutase/phosphoglucomutase [Immundisolibacter sp.]|uniref:phosphomannomutase/phosphoglucomutase n=1 Tax=Immundisolibacter sp. TaxID=1934948 RepID=UPI0019B09D5C|nr:phosphomannomutase/phosphoglucomutase [Immundisolibacter sp.]MBC7160498.1 phosphomannomutase/phosphoglucomutase [Immundisolibacter sp.]